MPSKAIARSEVNRFTVGIFDPFHPIALPPPIDGTFALVLLIAPSAADYDTSSFLPPKEFTAGNGLQPPSPSWLILLGT